MKVLTYNIHGWQTPAGSSNLDLLAEVIEASGADVVGLNEVSHPHLIDGMAALAALAGSLGMAYAFGPTIVRNPPPDGIPYGNALLCRRPILAFAAHNLTPMTSYGQRGLLEVRVGLPAGRPLTFYIIHLDHRSEDVRLQQWVAANTWLVRDRRRPHVLVGDFNALAATDYAAPADLDRLSALHSGRGWMPPVFDLIARVLTAGYVDAFASRSPVTTRDATWPANDPERRIDYIFVPEVWAESLISCCIWDSPAARKASDHLPVLAEIDTDAGIAGHD